VYGYIDRQNLPGTLRAFDFASPEQHAPYRFQTTVPQQALFLLNSPFAADAARAVAARVVAVQIITPLVTPASKVTFLYRAILSRNPTTEETALALAFVSAAEGSPVTGRQLTAWEQFAQVLLLSNEFAFAD
jgi:hypothetical protein